MFVVDTNILIYAADRESPFHEKSFQLLETSRRQASAWYLTWGICYEFLRVATHPQVFRKPWNIQGAWSFLTRLQESASLGFLIPTERHPQVAAEFFQEMPLLSGNILHDAQTAILMKEHGIRKIYTRDTDFHRFSFLEPNDPCR